MSYSHLNADDIATITTVFQFIDADHDGYITVDEIREACSIDINGDGIISDAEKDQCARIWLQSYMPLQDANTDHRLSLAECLAFNDAYKGKIMPLFIPA